MASMHESMHDRLQHTTIWGCTISLLFAVAESSGDEQARSTAMDMLAACRDTHEQFATWVSMVTARMRPEELRSQYPLYFRYADRAERADTAVPGVYLQLHAAQAVGRACMQGNARIGLVKDVLVGPEKITIRHRIPARGTAPPADTTTTIPTRRVTMARVIHCVGGVLAILRCAQLAEGGGSVIQLR